MSTAEFPNSGNNEHQKESMPQNDIRVPHATVGDSSERVIVAFEKYRTEMTGVLGDMIQRRELISNEMAPGVLEAMAKLSRRLFSEAGIEDAEVEMTDGKEYFRGKMHIVFARQLGAAVLDAFHDSGTILVQDSQLQELFREALKVVWGNDDDEDFPPLGASHAVFGKGVQSIIQEREAA